MRKLAEPDLVQKALDVLTGRARVKRTMWSRRAQEYEAKINSGDLISVAEVVRDLYRSEAQPEQSYSERQLYESALDRVVREISSVNKITETEALKLIEQSLAKSPRRAKGAEAEAERGRRRSGRGCLIAALPTSNGFPKARPRAGLFLCAGVLSFATLESIFANLAVRRLNFFALVSWQ